MSFCGTKRSCSFHYSPSLTYFLIITFLFIWLRTPCKVEASRMLQEQKEAIGDTKRLMTEEDHVKIQGTRKISTEVEHFREFFRGRAAAASDLNKDKGFEDNKRRVPSCPDALHNK
ncbi:hypothetical protein POM88_027640 [Heracleum sosnowskyi]|uniref:Uncharacterized protein n=1 Tax=Heracleum sosnowskyi TaxID=360622 RepID=A0AAD8MPQ2_9APIA|nr:hypothetical protein POM88_027640 [Heracleum sosnowskyi]